MTQLAAPDDFVIATGESHSLEEFLTTAFAEVKLDWRAHVDYDASLKRPSDIATSIGEPTKAQRILGWCAKVRFAEVVIQMVRSELGGAAAV